MRAGSREAVDGIYTTASDLITIRETLGFRASCEYGQQPGAEFRPGVVLDCFSGSGTTGVVAKKLGLAYIGIDTSADYCLMAATRIAESGHTGERGKQHLAAARGGQGRLFE